MVDFYEELNLNQDNSVADINRILNQLENTWRRREINNPEKATKMLALILGAKNAFKSDAAKSEYDCQLAESKKIPEQVDYNAERKVQFDKYRKQAEEYFANGNQANLAFEAMNRALQYKDPSQTDTAFLYLCSLIRCYAGDLQGSISDITDAIVTDPHNATYYRWKGDVLGELFNAAISKPNGLQTARQYLALNRDNYEKGLEIANQTGDKEEQIACLEGLAESYSLMYDSDFARAEGYVNQARALGDNSPEIQNIMQSIQTGKSALQPYQGKGHPSSESSGGACYIATAVYGSYDCPQVWTLRRYRDYSLSSTFFGRMFIRFYYLLSPKIIKNFGKKVWFNRMCRKRLDKLVILLQNEGYSSDRYID